MKYRVGAVEPGRRIWFDVGRAMPNGHGVELFPVENGTRVRHTLDSPLRGVFALLWPIMIRRAHDRAIEGLLDNLERAMARKTAWMP
jgi:carbon monoxide dehydrogenase subunit G